MPSEYSQDLRIELIANGEQSGTWGATTNNNLGTLIEDAISGAASQTTNVLKYALLAADGAADQARCAALILDTNYVGAGNYEVYAPPVTKLYVVKNASSTKDLDLYCGASANSTTVAVGGVAYTIPQGKTAFVRSNGTSFFDATDYVAGAVTFTNANLITPSLSGEKFSTDATVTAAGTVQANGTALTADYNVVTTVAADSGVVLPDATVGRRIIIINRGANALKVYPFAGGSQQIDSAGANNPISIPVNGSLEFNAATVNRWYSNTTLSLNDAVTTAVRVATTSGISSAGTTQGDATALTADYNIISTALAGSGVRLPTATIGRKVLVVNRGANSVNVYPASGAVIDSLGTNTAIPLPVNGLLEFNAAFLSPTPQWYSSYNATTAASVGGVSFTGTQPTASVNQVAVYGGTGNSITTARTYQFRATTAGQAQIQLFENATSGATDSITIQPPNTLAASYTLTLPADDGNPNEFLQTNGSGVLTWASATAGAVTSVTGSGAITASPTTGAVTVSVANASASVSGVVTTSTQTFAGVKTFDNSINVNGIVSTTGAYNFTSLNESIFGSAGLVSIAVGGSARIDVTTSEFTPDGDNNMNLGSGSKRWIQVYAVSGTINTSDADTKQDIADLDEAEKRVAARIKGLIKKFRFKDAVATKGDAARIHVGVIAQEVQDAFIAEGLDATRYGLFCSDTWWEREEEVEYKPAAEMRTVKKTYKEPVEGATEVTRLGVRYDELLAFVIAAM